MVASLPRWINTTLIKTQLWVSWNCAALGAAAALTFYNTIPKGRILALFFICLAGYHFYVLRIPKSWQELKFQKSFILFIMALIGLVGVITLFPSEFDPQNLKIMSILGFFSSLYSLPIQNRGLRNIPYFKIFYIALMWTLWILLFVLNDFNWIDFWAIFLFVLAITLPFDIRDLALNEKTISTLWGSQKAKMISIFLWVFSISLWAYAGNPFYVPFFGLFCIIGAALLFFVDSFGLEKSNQFYINFVIEGIPFLLFSGLLTQRFLFDF